MLAFILAFSLESLVTHSLRALDVDVFRLALEHLSYDMEGLRYLIQTIRALLELAPKDLCPETPFFLRPSGHEQILAR